MKKHVLMAFANTIAMVLLCLLLPVRQTPEQITSKLIGSTHWQLAAADGTVASVVSAVRDGNGQDVELFRRSSEGWGQSERVARALAGEVRPGVAFISGGTLVAGWPSDGGLAGLIGT